jgi:succinate dehydrogenase hydrophobic anchor subunit
MKRILNIAIGISFVALVYCVIGIIQTAAFEGAPNYSPIRERYNEHLWTSLSGVFLALSVLLIWLRMGVRRR